MLICSIVAGVIILEEKVSYLQETMLPNYIIAIYNCSMEATSKKSAIRLAVLSVGVDAIFIVSLASSTRSGLASAQQNKTLMQPHRGRQNTQGM